MNAAARPALGYDKALLAQALKHLGQMIRGGIEESGDFPCGEVFFRKGGEEAHGVDGEGSGIGYGKNFFHGSDPLRK